MPLHSSTFDYYKPTEPQLLAMEDARAAARAYARAIEALLPTGDDKDHVLRLIRDAAMWANVAITRCDDGRPRS